MEVVGKDYIWQMYRNVPSLIWRTAFMNERLFRVANGFYSALNDYHFYTPGDTRYMGSMGADWNRLRLAGCLADGDLDMTLLLIGLIVTRNQYRMYRTGTRPSITYPKELLCQDPR